MRMRAQLSSWVPGPIEHTRGRSPCAVRIRPRHLPRHGNSSFAKLLVNHIEGRALARAFDCQYVEVSARTGANVDQAFHDLVREMRRFMETRIRVPYLPPHNEEALLREYCKRSKIDEREGGRGARCVIC